MELQIGYFSIEFFILFGINWISVMIEIEMNTDVVDAVLVLDVWMLYFVGNRRHSR